MWDLIRKFMRFVRFAVVVLVVGLLLLAASELPAVQSLWQSVRPAEQRVGIVAGHWQSDSGAVCSDGLREVDLNLTIARLVAQRLEDMGYDAWVMAEFSPDLEGLEADAFVSIHCDSCVAGFSGFKIAGSTVSTAANQDALVSYLYTAYAETTGLAKHLNSITTDMSDYHAFREIDISTPGAIIECGFMSDDRSLLEDRPEIVAEGIAQGIAQFLQGEEQ